MALPPLAPVSDMETELGLAAGSLAGPDLARAEKALRDASGLVRAEGKDWVDADGVTITAPAVVVTITTQAALRQYRNPEGFQSEAVEGYSWQATPGAVGLYLSADEVRLIRRAAKRGGYTVTTPSAVPLPLASQNLMSWGLE